MDDSKINLIGKTLKETKQRRKLLCCKTYELKFDMSHMSNENIKSMNLLFIEAKWLYNHILSLDQSDEFDIFKFNPLIRDVKTLDHDKNVIERNLTIIGSQIKQSIHNRMLDSIKSLSELKKNGNNIGSLKFKSRINSIPLKQFNVTYKFHKSKENYVKIQNIKGYFKVNGRNQIPGNAEFSNATLVKKNNNFYLMATVFVPKTESVFEQKSVGIDFGIESTIALSTGEKFKVNFPETHRTKVLRRKLSRKIGAKKKERKSKSYLKNLNLVNISVDKINNKKKDIRHKIVSSIVNRFETVCVQDERIKEWKDGKFGKQVHNSVLGGIMSDLKNKSHILKTIRKYAPTTILCPKCLKFNHIGLSVRIYKCECGYIEDRDIKSAQTIEEMGMGRLDYESFLTEYKELKTPVEGCATVANFSNEVAISASQ